MRAQPRFRTYFVAIRLGGVAVGAKAVARSERPFALVLGNEEAGLRPAMLKACDEIIAIPGSGSVQSLNVAASAAILIYAMAPGSDWSRD